MLRPLDFFHASWQRSQGMHSKPWIPWISSILLQSQFFFQSQVSPVFLQSLGLWGQKKMTPTHHARQKWAACVWTTLTSLRIEFIDDVQTAYRTPRFMNNNRMQQDSGYAAISQRICFCSSADVFLQCRNMWFCRAQVPHVTFWLVAQAASSYGVLRWQHNNICVGICDCETSLKLQGFVRTMEVFMQLGWTCHWEVNFTNAMDNLDAKIKIPKWSKVH